MDTLISGWFHQHLTPGSVFALHVVSALASGTWIGIVLAMSLLPLVWKRHWDKAVAVILTVPGGMLLGEALKLLVQRPRPYQSVDWDGFSFPSGHTIGATLLYGLLAVFLLNVFKARRWQLLTLVLAAGLILLVGFSRIALGAHYLTDVIGAMVLGLTWLGLCCFGLQWVRQGRSRVVAVPDPLFLPSPVTIG